MNAPAASGRYAPIARALHWLTALLVIAMIPFGFLLLDLPAGRAQDTAFDLHRSTGVLLFVLTVVRLAYRATHPAPPLPPHLSPMIRTIAHATHVLLYVLLLVMPIVGWWATSAYGARINVFWLFELPPLVAQDKAVAEQAFAVHRAIGFAMAGLIAAHAGAALHHHFVRRDDVLRRML